MECKITVRLSNDDHDGHTGQLELVRILKNAKKYVEEHGFFNGWSGTSYPLTDSVGNLVGRVSLNLTASPDHDEMESALRNLHRDLYRAFHQKRIQKGVYEDMIGTIDDVLKGADQ